MAASEALAREDHVEARGTRRRTGLPILVAVANLLATESAFAQVSGVVLDEATKQPIAGAIVTLQATTTRTTTDTSGAFDLPGVSGADLVIAGAKKGYFIGSVTVTTPASAASITLAPVPPDDDASYSFRPATACSYCHPKQWSEWTGSRMAHAGMNTWVYDTYSGTGTPGGMGGFVYLRDSVHAAKNPSSECRSCHQPGPWIKAPHSALGDFAHPTSEMWEGVSCDVCHKIADIDTTKPNYPGIYPGVVTVTRPSAASGPVEYGPLPDVTFTSSGVMRASYQPEMGSAICAACHQDKNDPHETGDFESPDGVISEPTYLEWLKSPYADPGSAKPASCVDCHMKPIGTTNACEALFPPLDRDPSTIRSHVFEGTTAAYLEHAVTMKLTAAPVADKVEVEVSITNDQTGHSVPTGVTIRNMILVLDAWREQDGLPLVHVGTQLVDPLGGVGDPGKGYFGGLPGKLYAKHSVDAQGKGPVFYTEATGILWDNRIPALATDTTTYPFAVPAGGGTLHVRARLVYRRAFRSLIDAKGWTQDGVGGALEDLAAPDFGHLMAKAEEVVTLPYAPPDAGPDGGGGSDAGSTVGAGAGGGAGGSGSAAPAEAGWSCRAGRAPEQGAPVAAAGLLLALISRRRRARRRDDRGSH